MALSLGRHFLINILSLPHSPFPPSRSLFLVRHFSTRDNSDLCCWPAVALQVNTSVGKLWECVCVCVCPELHLLEAEFIVHCLFVVTININHVLDTRTQSDPNWNKMTVIIKHIIKTYQRVTLTEKLGHSLTEICKTMSNVWQCI